MNAQVATVLRSQPLMNAQVATVLQSQPLMNAQVATVLRCVNNDWFTSSNLKFTILHVLK